MNADPYRHDSVSKLEWMKLRLQNNVCDNEKQELRTMTDQVEIHTLFLSASLLLISS